MDLPSEYTPKRPQVISSSAVDSLPETYQFLQSVFPKVSENPTGNEYHERSTLAVQQGQFTTYSSGRGGHFGSGRGRFGGSTGVLAEEVILMVTEEIVVVDASLMAEGEILVVEEMKRQTIGNKR